MASIAGLDMATRRKKTFRLLAGEPIATLDTILITYPMAYLNNNSVYGLATMHHIVKQRFAI